MARHTIKIFAVDTVKGTANIGFIWGKMFIKQSIDITTLIVWTDQLVKYFSIERLVHRY